MTFCVFLLVVDHGFPLFMCFWSGGPASVFSWLSMYCFLFIILPK